MTQIFSGYAYKLVTEENKAVNNRSVAVLCHISHKV